MTEREYYLSISKTEMTFDYHKGLHKNPFICCRTYAKFYIKSVTKKECKELRNRIIPGANRKNEERQALCNSTHIFTF